MASQAPSNSGQISDFEKITWFCVDVMENGKHQKKETERVVKRLRENHGLYSMPCDDIPDLLDLDPEMGYYRIDFQNRGRSKTIIDGEYVVQFKCQGRGAAVTWSQRLGAMENTHWLRNKKMFMDYVIDHSLISLFRSQATIDWRRVSNEKR